MHRHVDRTRLHIDYLVHTSGRSHYTDVVTGLGGTIYHCPSPLNPFFFFFNDTATTEIYTLSLHDALPISGDRRPHRRQPRLPTLLRRGPRRSEEHTSELQSRGHLVCRLLLEKKKKTQ